MSVIVPQLAEAAATFDSGRAPLTATATVQPAPAVGTRAATPDPVGPAFHGLSAPATTPPEPDAHLVDISTLPWEGDRAALAEPGREPEWVPPVLAVYVTQQKKLAASQAAQGLDFTDYLPALRDATKVGREALAKGQAERDEAKRFGVTGRQLEALDANQAAPIARTKEAMQAAIAVVAGVAVAKLAAEEAKALSALARPGVQPDETDYAAANDLSQTLNLMPPAFAIPLLRAQLIELPVKTGKGIGKAAAMAPLLAARIERDPQWNASDEARELVKQLQLVTRNAAWYAAHMRLTKIHGLTYKVQSLTEDYAKHYGDERADGYLRARDATVYAELGVQPLTESEVQAIRDAHKARRLK